jgi:predicted TIM-barrel fold metal-dependent hydrolase
MRLDGHIHAGATAPEPARLLAEMRAAGLEGGTIISAPPAWWQEGRLAASPAADRLAALRAWTAGQPALHPVFWVDPTAADASAQVAQAAADGVAAFKVICSTHAPDDPRAMPVYRAIAALDRPILFHSGILWDGQPSSPFNRPAAFECLLDVPRLRFALAHISWPWVDECIAVYGKFLNATDKRPDAPEMFVDTTPGTPPIYREEALTKLYTVGYDVAGNVFFGTDCSTASYGARWSREWQERDEAILRKIGVDEAGRAAYFGGNLLRWLRGPRRAACPPKAGE